MGSTRWGRDDRGCQDPNSRILRRQHQFEHRIFGSVNSVAQHVDEIAAKTNNGERWSKGFGSHMTFKT